MQPGPDVWRQLILAHLEHASCPFGSSRGRNRFATDSPLEGRVTSEPVSEMGFSWANYGPIPRRLWMMSEA
jgi:hypothetical protein